MKDGKIEDKQVYQFIKEAEEKCKTCTKFKKPKGRPIAWAVNAKNSMSNVFGYSPHQLVFGANPKVPSILTDQTPALEGVTSTQIIADHLNALTAARKAFVEAESSGKIKRALARKTRPVTSLIFET